MQEVCIEELLSVVDPNYHLLYVHHIARSSMTSNSSASQSDDSSSYADFEPTLPTSSQVKTMTLEDFDERCAAYERHHDGLKVGERRFVANSRRRIVNRESAREARQRKKRELEQLNAHVVDLEDELAYLREVVRQSERFLDAATLERLRQNLRSGGYIEPVKI
jgi:RecA-family ATPase